MYSAHCLSTGNPTGIKICTNCSMYPMLNWQHGMQGGQGFRRMPDYDDNVRSRESNYKLHTAANLEEVLLKSITELVYDYPLQSRAATGG